MDNKFFWEKCDNVALNFNCEKSSFYNFSNIRYENISERNNPIFLHNFINFLSANKKRMKHPSFIIQLKTFEIGNFETFSKTEYWSNFIALFFYEDDNNFHFKLFVILIWVSCWRWNCTVNFFGLKLYFN